MNAVGTREFGRYCMELGRLHEEQVHSLEFKCREDQKTKARSNFRVDILTLLNINSLSSFRQQGMERSRTITENKHLKNSGGEHLAFFW